MISCKKYTRFLHKSEITPLKWHEKLLMKSHFLICKLCRQYTLENSIINQIFQQHQEHLMVSDEELERYKKELLQNLHL